MQEGKGEPGDAPSIDLGTSKQKALALESKAILPHFPEQALTLRCNRSCGLHKDWAAKVLTLNLSKRSEAVVAAREGEAFTSTSQGFKLSSMSMSYPYSSKQCLNTGRSGSYGINCACSVISPCCNQSHLLWCWVL